MRTHPLKKLEKIRKIVDERNRYLSEHPKVNVATALSLVNERIEKLNISGRELAVVIDEDALNEIVILDGCYVIVCTSLRLRLHNIVSVYIFILIYNRRGGSRGEGISNLLLPCKTIVLRKRMFFNNLEVA